MERPEANLVELGAAVQAALAAESHPSAEIRLARAGFLEHVSKHNLANQRTRSRGVFPIALLAGATAAAAIGLWVWYRQPVTFDVGSTAAHGQPGDLVQATAATPTPIRFSEGSSLAIH
jgi:negative regulator of sigma E activity